MKKSKFTESQIVKAIKENESARAYILHRHGQDLKWQTINGDYSAMYKFYREVLNLPWDVKQRC